MNRYTCTVHTTQYNRGGQQLRSRIVNFQIDAENNAQAREFARLFWSDYADVDQTHYVEIPTINVNPPV